MSRTSGRFYVIWIIVLWLFMLPFFVTEALAAINGSLDLSYKNYETKGSNSVTTKNTTMTQRYNINYRGFLYDRRTATLDAGITYDLQDNKYADQKTSTKNLGFTFNSIILPRSPIPLTIYGNRYTSDSQSRPNPGYKTTNTVYGFFWVLPFRGNIPEVNILYNETRLEDGNPTNPRDETSRAATFTLSKRKKLTYYWLSYRYGTTSSGGGASSDSQALDFKGWWKVTPNSIVDLTSSLQDNGSEKIFRTRVHYDITISQKMNARADYQYEKRDQSGVSTTDNSLNTSLYYRPSSRITSTSSYSFNTTDSGSSTSTSNYISESLTATVMPTLTVNGDASYSTTSSDGGTSTDISKYNLGALYYKSFSRAQWSLGATMGYSIVSGETTERISTRSEYTGLSSRNFRYVNAMTSLSNYSTTSSNSTSREEYQFVASVSSNYFRRLNVLVNYNYNIVNEDFQTGPSSRRTFSTFDTRATYNLWYGMIVGAGYNLRMSSSSNDEEHTYLQWDWNLALFRRIAVSMSAKRETRTANDQNDSTSYSYSARAAYRIGRLALSFEYSYLKEDQKLNDREEKTYFIRATRTF